MCITDAATEIDAATTLPQQSADVSTNDDTRTEAVTSEVRTLLEVVDPSQTVASPVQPVANADTASTGSNIDDGSSDNQQFQDDEAGTVALDETLYHDCISTSLNSKFASLCIY